MRMAPMVLLGIAITAHASTCSAAVSAAFRSPHPKAGGTPALHVETKITVDRNMAERATGQFRFEHVASPAKDDAAAKATLTLIAGALDGNSAALAALVDGALPSDWDQPEANVFFRANSWGGRVRIDLGRVVPIAQINTYSWHPDSRAPQLYKLYGSDGTEAAIDLTPSNKFDPEKAGWKLIAFVDTRPAEGEMGGQFAVSLTDSTGTLGRYRYLLFDAFETESDDNWGNTFYSEIDVVAELRRGSDLCSHQVSPKACTSAR